MAHSSCAKAVDQISKSRPWRTHAAGGAFCAYTLTGPWLFTVESISVGSGLKVQQISLTKKIKFLPGIILRQRDGKHQASHYYSRGGGLLFRPLFTAQTISGILLCVSLPQHQIMEDLERAADSVQPAPLVSLKLSRCMLRSCCVSPP